MKTIGTMLRACGALLMTTSIVCSVIRYAPAIADDAIDLDHLTFTATGSLTATFVEPASGDASPVEATRVVVATVRGAGVALRVNGESVPTKQLGKRTVDAKTGVTQYTFYGVPLKPGPNELIATPLGAGDAAGAPVSETVYGPAEAASIRAEIVQHLVADGVTIVPLNLTVLDRFGHPAMPAQSLHISLISGDVRFVDADKLAVRRDQATPAPAVTSSPDRHADGQVVDTVVPVGGYLALRVRPGTVAGPFEIEVAAGAARLRKRFYVDPFVRPAFVNGVLSGGIGSVPAAIDGDGIADEGGARRGRAGIYVNGAVAPRTLVTVAYESQNRLSPVSSFGSYVLDPNERPYQTYGDTSQTYDTLHSADHLYARIERGQSSAMWGQFDARIGPADLGGYQQLLSGAKATLAIGRDARAQITAFTAHDDHAFVSTVLPISGLADLVQPLRPDIVVGSDVFAVVTFDRKTGVMLGQTPLLRNVDYTIDYATGVVRFVNVPLPFDQFFNPEALSIQYEYYGTGVSSRTTGGELRLDLSNDRRTRATFAYVNDATGVQNFSLASQALGRTWTGGSWSIAHASSRGLLENGTTLAPLGGTPVPAGGDALSVLMNERGALGDVALAYQSTTAGYSDPFGGLSSPGLTAYRASWKRGDAATGSVEFAFSGQRNRGVGTASDETDATLRVERKLGRAVTANAGLVLHEQHVAAATASPVPGTLATTSQTQAEIGIDYRPVKRLGIDVQTYRTLSGSDRGSTQPSQTIAQLNYALPNRGQIFVRELWSESPSATFANSTSNLGIAASSTHSMQIGVEKAISPSTTVSSQYVVSDTGSALDIYDAIGVQEHLRFGPAFTGSVDVQAANAAGAGATGFTLFGGTLAYAQKNGDLRASASYQDRTGAAAGSTYAFGMAGRVTTNVSVLAAITRAYASSTHAVNDRVTLAYRPASNDRFISLLGYTRTNGASQTGDAANVVSFEELYRPWNGFEIAGRAAYKLDGTGNDAARSSLYALRVRQNVCKRFDVGGEVRTLDVPGGAGARATEFAVETGVTAGREARIAAGYNFSASVDPTLTGRQRRGFYMTFTTLVDRIFGWGTR